MPKREILLTQATGLHELARRMKGVANWAPSSAEQQRLLRHALELEEQALRFEQDAADY